MKKQFVKLEKKNDRLWNNHSSKSLAALIGCISIYGITISLFTPLLSIILEYRGTSSTVIGGLAMMSPAGIIFGSFFVPYLLRKFEGRNLLIFGVIIEIILIFFLMISESIFTWFLIRLIGGIVGSILFIVTETWIITITPNAHRGKLMGLYNTTLAFSLSIGPLILSITDLHGTLPFILGIVLMILATLPLLWIKECKLNSNEDSGFGVLNFVFIAPLLTISCFVVAFKEITMTSLLPVYGIRLGMSENYATLMLFYGAAGAALLQLPIGWAADKLDHRKVFFSCAIIGLIGSSIWPFLLDISIFLWITLFIWWGFFAAIYTISMIFAAKWFKGNKLSTAMASFGIFWGLGSFTGPILGGISMDIWDPHGLPLILFILSAILFIISLFPKLYLTANKVSK